MFPECSTNKHKLHIKVPDSSNPWHHPRGGTRSAQCVPLSSSELLRAVPSSSELVQSAGKRRSLPERRPYRKGRETNPTSKVGSLPQRPPEGHSSSRDRPPSSAATRGRDRRQPHLSPLISPTGRPQPHGTLGTMGWTNGGIGALDGWRGSQMSHVYFKKRQCRMPMSLIFLCDTCQI